MTGKTWYETARDEHDYMSGWDCVTQTWTKEKDNVYTLEFNYKHKPFWIEMAGSDKITVKANENSGYFASVYYHWWELFGHEFYSPVPGWAYGCSSFLSIFSITWGWSA